MMEIVYALVLMQINGKERGNFSQANNENKPTPLFWRVDFSNERMELVPLIINLACIATSGRNQLSAVCSVTPTVASTSRLVDHQPRSQGFSSLAPFRVGR